ncbi:MAG TPA: FliG C-terminal domain-containing protein, partial [Leptospiraceae bacterium]|nr:FliG C-terminal domain-containing protein [Leptospiraceae bacterium]
TCREQLMSFDDRIFSKFDFSEVDREKCIPLIEEIIRLAELSRKQGLLLLEEELSTIKDPYLKMGLQLIIDGTEPDLVEEILDRIVFFSNASPERVLEFCIMRTGILSIQAGNNPYVLNHQLYAYIGIEYIEEYNFTEPETRIRELVVNSNFVPLDISLEFNFLFSRLDDFSVQRIVREIDLNVLGCAMTNVSIECESKILSNISTRAALLLSQERQFRTIPLEECIENQQMILELYERLVEMGEIIRVEE